MAKPAIKTHTEPYWDISLKRTVHPGSVYHTADAKTQKAIKSWLSRTGNDSERLAVDLAHKNGCGVGSSNFFYANRPGDTVAEFAAHARRIA